MIDDKNPDLAVDEESSGALSFLPTDVDGSTLFPVAQITTMTLRLTNEADGAVINARTEFALATDGAFVGLNGRVDGNGRFWFKTAPEDNIIVDTSLPYGEREKHRALIHFETSTGYVRNKELFIRVRHLKLVTYEVVSRGNIGIGWQEDTE